MAKAKPAPAKEAIADGATLPLVAIEPIRLDGEDIAPGTTFGLEPGKAADALLASGAARIAEVE